MTNTTLPQAVYARGPGTTGTSPFVTIFENRDPTVYDVNYNIQQRWVNLTETNEWMLVSYSNATGQLQANWIQISSQSSQTEFLTGNSGGVVAPDSNNNINVVGDTTTINIVGNPTTHTLTASTTGSIASSYFTNSGTAVPSSGILNVLGSAGITTTGSGNTVTIAPSTVPAFGAYLNPTITNATGDGTVISAIPFNQVVFDTTSSYNTSTGVYTVPVSGVYLFTTCVVLTGLTSSHTTGGSAFENAGTLPTYSTSGWFGNTAAVQSGGEYIFNYSAIFIMSVGDTMNVNLQVLGGTKVVNISGMAIAPGADPSQFCGCLLARTS